MFEVAKFLDKIIVLCLQLFDLGKMGLIYGVKLFLKHLESGSGLAIVTGHLMLLVQRLDHRLMLPLGLLQLIFGFLKLQCQELYLLVSHRNCLLGVMAHLHEGLLAFLDFPLKILDLRLLTDHLTFTLFEFR